MRFLEERDLVQAIEALRLADPSLVGLMVDRAGLPRLRQRPAGYAGLAAIVVAQQVSTASAAAIFARLASALDPLTPAALLAADSSTLRGCGLSAGKIGSLRAAAEAVRDGTLGIETLGELPADEAHRRLTAIRGIGPWTADIFLLFCLGHADAWPAGDLALQEAVRVLLGRAERPSARELAAVGERWRPYRGAAAHLLWAYYRVANRPRSAARAAT